MVRRIYSDPASWTIGRKRGPPLYGVDRARSLLLVALGMAGDGRGSVGMAGMGGDDDMLIFPGLPTRHHSR